MPLTCVSPALAPSAKCGHIALMIKPIFLLCALGLGLAACSPAPEPTASDACLGRAYEEIGGPISLINQDGVAVTEEDFKGRPSLVYFGFAYCPDVCPATLSMLERAFRRLPEDISPPRTILISVDPERDTPDALKSYISYDAFPDDIVGLTGTEDQIRAAADEFLTDYSRVELPDSEAGYTMDHQSIVFLMDETWTLKTFFTHLSTDEDIASCLEAQLG